MYPPCPVKDMEPEVRTTGQKKKSYYIGEYKEESAILGKLYSVVHIVP